jgi:YVTN family beta-propeller protein
MLSHSLLACLLASSAALAATVGPQADGTSITPQGFKLTPAGTQTDTDSGPLAVAISPLGNIILVENAGYQTHSLQVYDTNGTQLQDILMKEGSNSNFYQITAGHSHSMYTGLVFSADGKTAFASDPGGSGIHRFTISGNTVTEANNPINIGNATNGKKIYPAGLALSKDNSIIYVTGHLTDDLRFYKTSDGTTLGIVPVGHRPYATVLNRAGTLAFVSNWGTNTVSVVSLATKAVIATTVTGMHPCAMIANPVNDEIYVTNSDSDTVSVLNGLNGVLLRTISMRPSPTAGLGASPNALSISSDGKTLYVANAMANDVAVVALSTKGDAVKGLIPTGWYPSAIALNATNSTLYVTNMKAMGVGPNTDFNVYWSTRLSGSLSRIPVPSATTLATYTTQVKNNNAFGKTPPAPPSGSVVGNPSPIKHVIYVLKENRGYDQILGDLGRGNSDPSLTQWGEVISPNHHALARQFVTFDNYYADAEVSWDGWNWATGAISNTFTQKNWPLDYGYYDYPDDEGGGSGWSTSEVMGLPGENPGKSAIWDKLKAKGIPFVNFGFYVGNPPVADPISMPGLVGVTDSVYPGWDLNTTDQVRMDRWMTVFNSYKQNNNMPTVQFVYLPSDHTNGSGTVGHRPQNYIADNDLALGRLVDVVSHSQFWKDTAIFVTEDDAQDGFDHVDAHRTIGYIISPYTQTGAVDSTLYSNVSMLRTMEMILGVTPMTLFDASTSTMAAAFSSVPNLNTYTALTPVASADENINTPEEWAKLEKMTATLDLSKPDRIDMATMNEILWKSAKGNAVEVPAVKHVAYIQDGEDDDDANENEIKEFFSKLFHLSSNDKPHTADHS